MKNQTKKTKKQSNQPVYEDKPWQAPQYGEKSDNTQDDVEEGSCGCGSNDEKGKKKNSSLTAATDT